MYCETWLGITIGITINAIALYFRYVWSVAARLNAGTQKHTTPHHLNQIQVRIGQRHCSPFIVGCSCFLCF